MRRLLDMGSVPGLLALGAVVGVLLLPLLWLARLGVSALHSRATSFTVAPEALPTNTPVPRVTPVPQLPVPSSAASPTLTEPPALSMPVRGARRSVVPDTFGERRGSRRHEGVDIRAPRGTPVLAASEGRIARLSHSAAGGIEIYQLDGDRHFCLYYAHLLRYVGGLREGLPVKRGQVIGYVGVSGNAPNRAPHLHFGVLRTQTPERCDGEPLNPLPLLR
jgi:murein DD-endopeptidase MepM/ murein hydrolase activator NlpD